MAASSGVSASCSCLLLMDQLPLPKGRWPELLAQDKQIGWWQKDIDLVNPRFLAVEESAWQKTYVLEELGLSAELPASRYARLAIFPVDKCEPEFVRVDYQDPKFIEGVTYPSPQPAPFESIDYRSAVSPNRFLLFPEQKQEEKEELPDHLWKDLLDLIGKEKEVNNPHHGVDSAVVDRLEDAYIVDSASLSMKQVKGKRQDPRQWLLAGVYLNNRGVVQEYFMSLQPQCEDGTQEEIDVCLQEEALCVAAVNGNVFLLQYLMEWRRFLTGDSFSFFQTLQFLAWVAVSRCDELMFELILNEVETTSFTRDITMQDLVVALDGVDYGQQAPLVVHGNPEVTLTSNFSTSVLHMKDSGASLLSYMMKELIADPQEASIRSILTRYLRFLAAHNVGLFVEELTRGVSSTSPPLVSVICCESLLPLDFLFQSIQTYIDEVQIAQVIYDLTKADPRVEGHKSYTSLAVGRCTEGDVVSQQMASYLIEQGAYLDSSVLAVLIAPDSRLRILSHIVPLVFTTRFLQPKKLLKHWLLKRTSEETLHLLHELLAYGHISVELAKKISLAPVVAAEGAPNKLLQTLLSLGSSPSVPHPLTGQPAVHAAVETKNASALAVLLAHGASLYLEDANGRTAVEIAVVNNQLDCFKAIYFHSTSTPEGVTDLLNEAKKKRDLFATHLKSDPVKKMLNDLVRLHKDHKKKSQPKSAQPVAGQSARKKRNAGAKKKGKGHGKSKFWDGVVPKTEEELEEERRQKEEARLAAVAAEVARKQALKDAADKKAAEEAAEEARRAELAAREAKVPSGLFSGALNLKESQREEIVAFFNFTDEERESYAGDAVREIVFSELPVQENGSIRMEQVVFEMNYQTGSWRKFTRNDREDDIAPPPEDGNEEDHFPEFVAPAPAIVAEPVRPIGELIERRDLKAVLAEITRKLQLAQSADGTKPAKSALETSRDMKRSHAAKARDCDPVDLPPVGSLANLPWAISIASSVAEDWARLLPQERADAMATILRLGSGDRSSTAALHVCAEAGAVEESVLSDVYSTYFSQELHLAVIWQLAYQSVSHRPLQGNPSFSQAIRIWAIVPAITTPVREDGTHLFAGAVEGLLRAFETGEDEGDLCDLDRLPTSTPDDNRHYPAFCTVPVDQAGGARVPEFFFAGSLHVLQTDYVEKFFELTGETLDSLMSLPPLDWLSYEASHDHEVYGALSKAPFCLSPCQLEIIHQEGALPKLQTVIGLAGTGKTTAAIHRMVELRRMHGAPDAGGWRQMYVSPNPIASFEAGDLFSSLLGQNKKPRDSPPLSMGRLPPGRDPLFTHRRQWILMVDGCLPEPFFAREHGHLLQSSQFFGKHHAYTDAVQLEGRTRDADLRSAEAFQALQDSYGWVEVDFHTFSDLVWPVLPSMIMDFDASRFDPVIVYHEIMTVIKGSHQAILDPLGVLSREDYLARSKETKCPFLEDCGCIYSLFEAYEHFKEEQFTATGTKLFDWADFVSHCFQQRDSYSGTIFDHAVLDDVQDYSEAEVLLLASISRHLLCLGDSNLSWMEHGSGPRFSTLSSFVAAAGLEFEAADKEPGVEDEDLFWSALDESGEAPVPGSTAKSYFCLTTQFRFHGAIRGPADAIVQLIAFNFPLHHQIMPPLGGSIRCGSSKVVFVEPTNHDILRPFRSLGAGQGTPTSWGAPQVVVVRTQKEKLTLPRELHGLLCLTVFETRGLEFDNVLLFNFFADSPARSVWTTVRRLEADESPTHCFALEFNKKRHQSLGSELQALYAVITRARNRLWVFDEDISARAAMFELFSKHDIVTVVRSSLLLEDSVAAKSKLLGMQLMCSGAFREAALCFSCCGEDLLQAEAEAHSLVLEGKNASHSGATEEASRLFLEAAVAYLELSLFAEAGRTLLLANEVSHANTAAKIAGDHNLSRACDASEMGLDVTAFLEEQVAEVGDGQECRNALLGQLRDLEVANDFVGWVKLCSSNVQKGEITDPELWFTSEKFFAMLCKSMTQELARVRADVFTQEIPLRILHAAAEPAGLGEELVDSLTGQARNEDAVDILLLQGKSTEALALAADLPSSDTLFCCLMVELANLVERGTAKQLTKREERVLKSHATLVLQQQKDLKDPKLGVALATFGRQQRDLSLLRQAATLLEADRHLVAHAECLTSIVLVQLKHLGPSPPQLTEAGLVSDVICILEPLVEMGRILASCSGLSREHPSFEDLAALGKLLFYLGLSYVEKDDYSFIAKPVAIHSSIFSDIPDPGSVTADVASLIDAKTGIIPADSLLEHLLERTFVAIRYWFACLTASSGTVDKQANAFHLLASLSVGKSTNGLASIFASCDFSEAAVDSDVFARIGGEIWKGPFGASDLSLEMLLATSPSPQEAAEELVSLLFPLDTTETPDNQQELLDRIPRGACDLLASNAVAAIQKSTTLQEAMQAFRVLLATDTERSQWPISALADSMSDEAAEEAFDVRHFPPAAQLILAQKLRENGHWLAATEVDSLIFEDTGAIDVLERRLLWALVMASGRHGPGSESLLWTNFLTILHCSSASDPNCSLAKQWRSRDDVEGQVDGLIVLNSCCQQLSVFNVNLRNGLLDRRDENRDQLRRGVHRSATLAALLMLNHLAQAAFPPSFALSSLLSCLSETSDLAAYVGDHRLAKLLKNLQGTHARTPLSPLVSEFTAHLRSQRESDFPVRLSLEKGKASLLVASVGPVRQVNGVFSADVQQWRQSSSLSHNGNALAEVVSAADSPRDAFLAVVAR